MSISNTRARGLSAFDILDSLRTVRGRGPHVALLAAELGCHVRKRVGKRGKQYVVSFFFDGVEIGVGCRGLFDVEMWLMKHRTELQEHPEQAHRFSVPNLPAASSLRSRGAPSGSRGRPA